MKRFRRDCFIGALILLLASGAAFAQATAALAGRVSAATFGRIQSQAGDPRILQFGVKYGF